MRPILHKLGLQLPLIKTLLRHRDDLVAENALLKERLLQPNIPDNAVEQGSVGQLCSTVDPSHYLDPEWLALHHDLSRYSGDKHCFQNCSGEIYRKGWEWTHCLYGLRKLGMLLPGNKAVGVGVGRESVIYFLADHIAEVTATDLYGEEAWSTEGGREADLKLLNDSKSHCPTTVDFSKIRFENQDGTKLTHNDNQFDFAWSLSSIEHFGGHDAARQAVQEMARVVRPGGIVAIATEMLLLEEYSHPEYFTYSEMIAELLEPCKNLELVGPINSHTLPYEFLVDSVVVPTDVHRRRRHVVLNDGRVQWTSILLFLRVLVQTDQEPLSADPTNI